MIIKIFLSLLLTFLIWLFITSWARYNWGREQIISDGTALVMVTIPWIIYFLIN